MDLAGSVQKAVDVLESNPEVAMVFGQVEVINEDGKQIAKFRPVAYRFEDLLTYRIIIPQQAAFFRRSVLENIGELDTNLHFALDHDFFLRIGMNYPVVSIPEVMAQYRISKFNKGSISRSKWAEEFVQILDNFYLQPEAKHKFGQYERSAYAGAYYNGACSLLDESFYVQARRWYLISAKYSQNILFGVRWWIGFIRTFLGKGGNILYVNLKIWLAKKNLIDFQYDWWVALTLSETNKD